MAEGNISVFEDSNGNYAKWDMERKSNLKNEEYEWAVGQFQVA